MRQSRIRRLTYCALSASVAWICAGTIRAEPAWQSLGPEGGDQFTVRLSPADPNTIFLTSHSSVHRSRDAGETWSPVHVADMARGTIHDLAFDPTNADQIVVCSQVDGVWFSPDEGESWQRRSNGLPVDDEALSIYWPVSSLAVDGNGRLFAGLIESLEGIVPSSLVYSSTDFGLTWAPDAAGIQSPAGGGVQDVTALASADAAGRAWAMAHGSGVYSYSNGTWTCRNGNLPAAALRGTFLAHDAQDAQRLLLGTEDDWVYETTNGGQTWSMLTLPDEIKFLNNLPLVYSIAIDPNNGDVLWVDAHSSLGATERPLFHADTDHNAGQGKYWSTDGGSTWTQSAQQAFRIAVDPSETTNVASVVRSKRWYSTAGALLSFMRSEDGGQTFVTNITGIKNGLINHVWVHPDPPAGQSNMLYALAEEGLFLMTNGSSDWAFTKSVEWLAYSWSLAADYNDPESVYYAVGNPSWSFPWVRGVYRGHLSDFNTYEAAADQILNGIGVWRVVTTPDYPELVYAGAQDAGLWVSTNAGTDWAAYEPGLGVLNVTDVELSGSGAPEFVSVRASGGNPLADPPQSWLPLPDEPGAVYRNAGSYWTNIPGVISAVVDLERVGGTGTLYAATARGLYKSEPPWSTLVRCSPDVVVYDVLVHPNNPEYLYAATPLAIYRSSNGGDQWHELSSNGLTMKRAYTLAMDPGTEVLYAGTGGNAVFMLPPDPDPHPVMGLSADSVDFGAVPVGIGYFKDVPVMLVNDGETDLVVTGFDTDLEFPVYYNFLPLGSSLPQTVPPGSWLHLTVRFTPSSAGVKSADIVFHGTGTNSPVSLAVTGEGYTEKGHLNVSVVPTNASWTIYRPWGGALLKTGDFETIGLGWPTGVYTIQWHEVEGCLLPTNSPATPAVENGQTAYVSAEYIPVTAPSQWPLGGTPWPVPGTIQAEDFDEGGEGAAYHDTTASNDGDSSYRAGEGVDINEKTGIAQNDNCLIAVRAGEWLEYTVNIATDGLYTVGTRVALKGNGGTFHLEVDGSDVSGPLQVPDTGGWYTWTTLEKTDVLLPAGEHVLRVEMDSNGPGGSVGIFDALEFTYQAPPTPKTLTVQSSGAAGVSIGISPLDKAGEGGGVTPFTRSYDAGTLVTLTAPVEASGEPFAGWSGVDGSSGTTATVTVSADLTVTASYGIEDNQDPFGGTPWPVPGTIQAEDFDEGGEGEAYHDTTASNDGDSSYRSGEGVDINEKAGIAQNDNCLIAVRAGERLEYTVNIATGGLYTVGARVALKGVGGTFHLEVDGSDVTGPLQVPDTGGWYSWTTVEKSDVLLPAGEHVLRVEMDSNGPGGSVGVFDALEFTYQAPPGPVGLLIIVAGASDVPIGVTPLDRNGEGDGVAPFLRSYDAGAEVTLTAPVEASGEPFAGWSGVDSSSGTTATVTVSADLTVTANYGIEDNQDPFGGTPWPVPGTIQAEDFDEGGEGEAYHDTTASNEGGSSYRTGEGVDVRDRDTAQNGRCLIAVRAGEWLEYTVDMATGGLYTVGARVALKGVGGTFHLKVDGSDVTGPLQVPDTGGWYTWTTVEKSDVLLPAGDHVLRVAMDSNGPGGSVGVFDALVFTYQAPPTPKTLTVQSSGAAGVSIGVSPLDKAGEGGGVTLFTRSYDAGTLVTLTAPAEASGEPFLSWSGVDGSSGTTATVTVSADLTVTANYGIEDNQDPFGGTPWPVPGTIQAEDFDEGGEAEAYHDTTASNDGGSSYRTGEGVDIKTRWSAQNSHCVIAVKAGEWLEYTVLVEAGGLYTLDARVSMSGDGGTFHLEVDGSDVTGPLQVPDTGGWYNWITVQATDMALTAGERIMRLVMDSNGPAGSVGVFDALEFSLQPAGRMSVSSMGEESSPPAVVEVQTSGGREPYTNGWHVVDGDEDTMWVGADGSQGWWLVLAYDRDVLVNTINLVYDDDSCTNLTVLGSLDAEEWFDMGASLVETDPVPAGYLWFIFADEGATKPPAVREIYVR